MQQIAMENNLAETAYVLETNDGYNLRWFTPSTEIRLCGHGTLATAHILWEKGLLDNQKTARFFTKSGLLTVIKKGDFIQMSFPAFSYEAYEVPGELLQALNIVPVATFRAQDERLVIEVADENIVRSLSPDFTILKKHESVVVTSKAAAGSPYDFISRSFASAHGVDEDPVTGSSHCVLVPYWADKLGKKTFSAYQASARGGELKLELAGDKVLIEGKAVTVIEGVFTVGEEAVRMQN